MYVICPKCRDVHAAYFLRTDAPPQETNEYGSLMPRPADHFACQHCGGPVQFATSAGKYAWAPPKKTNSRAWSEIKRGNLLWDTRRAARAMQPIQHTGKFKNIRGYRVEIIEGPDETGRPDIGGFNIPGDREDRQRTRRALRSWSAPISRKRRQKGLAR